MVLKNITKLMQQQQSRRVIQPLARASISPRSAESEGASTIGGGLGKFHREALRDAPADYQAFLKVPKRQGSEVAQVVPSKVYATIDGFIMIAVGNDKLFALFARVLGQSNGLRIRGFALIPTKSTTAQNSLPLLTMRSANFAPPICSGLSTRPACRTRRSRASTRRSSTGKQERSGSCRGRQALADRIAAIVRRDPIAVSALASRTRRTDC